MLAFDCDETGSPLGEASGHPSGLELDTTTKGERSMNAGAWRSM
jgi:hypothetical protein